MTQPGTELAPTTETTDEGTTSPETGGEETGAAGSESGEQTDLTDQADLTDQQQEQATDPDLKGVSPKQQARIERKLATAHGTAKQAQEEAEAAKADAAAARAELSQLQKLVEAGLVDTLAKAGLAPGYVTPADAQLLKQDEELRDAENYLVRYPARKAAGKVRDGEPDLDDEAVAEKLVEIRNKRMDVAPAASARRRELLRQQEEDRERGRALKTKPGATTQAAATTGARPAGTTKVPVRIPAAAAGSVGGARNGGHVQPTGTIGADEDVSVEGLAKLYQGALRRVVPNDVDD